MRRTAVNPWEWSKPLGYDQAHLVEGAARHLWVAGQTAVDAAGAPRHAGDMRAQVGLAAGNLLAVLDAAGMAPSDLTRLTIFATDVDACMGALDVLGDALAGATPPMTLVGVARLALPGLMVELEAAAAA